MEEPIKTAFLTSKEVAEILRVTPATVMNMIKRGQLRGKKVGAGGVSSPWRIPKEDVIEYVGSIEEKSSVKAST
ncbi:helix-turn-helix domain-containing protein [Candidatus Poribacteria bacterium]